MKGNNLLEVWESVKLSIPGTNLSDALDDLNAESGKHYDLNRFGKWRRGDEKVPAGIHKIMRRDVVATVLHAEGIYTLTLSDEQLDRIVDRLSM